MKNKLKILTILALGFFLLSKCERDPDLNMPDLKSAVIPKVTKDPGKDQTIFIAEIADFAGSVITDFYWPKDKPKSMDLIVAYNDEPDTSITVISNITSWPTKFDFTVASLVDIIPNLNDIAEVENGDFFRFYTNITLEDGTLIRGRDTLYAAFSSGIANLPNSSTSVVYKVYSCRYDPVIASGSFHSISEDWVTEGDITIAVDPDDNTTVYVTGIEEIEGLVEDKGPLVMHIDTDSFIVTADHSVIASDFFGLYHNIAYEGDGTFDPCTGTYEMSFAISVDEGSFGTFAFTFTKN